MPTITLEVIATRNVTLGDIAAAARASGHPLLHYDGRINLSSHIGDAYKTRDDVTFSADCGQRKISFALDPSTGEFAAPPNTVVFDLEGCTELHERRIFATCRTPSPLPAEQLDALLGAIATAFDARPSVIMNRTNLKTGPPHPQTTDTLQDVNDYWGFDVAIAMKMFTVPSLSWPDDNSERLFECWRCAAFCPSTHFPGRFGEYDEHSGGVNRIASVLGRAVIDGNMSACKRCVLDATVRPTTTPRTRKMLETDASHQPLKRAHTHSDGVGGWLFEVQVMVEGNPIRCSTFHHVGYIAKTFSTKQAAADEYRAANPHMRSIQRETDWTSDWDPVTRRRFIIRKNSNVECMVACPW